MTIYMFVYKLATFNYTVYCVKCSIHLKISYQTAYQREQHYTDQT